MDKSKFSTALNLMNSMILSGENHTAESKRVLEEAKAELVDKAPSDVTLTGLYRKYIILRTDGTPVADSARYFVLKYTGTGPHADACRAALGVYAGKIAPHLPVLAADLVRAITDADHTTDAEQWFLSRNAEDWSDANRAGPYPSRKEAIEDGPEIYDMPPGEKFWTARRGDWVFRMDGEAFLEDIADHLEHNSNGAASGFLHPMVNTLEPGQNAVPSDMIGNMPRRDAVDWLSHLLSATFVTWLKILGVETGLWCMLDVEEHIVGNEPGKVHEHVWTPARDRAGDTCPCGGFRQAGTGRVHPVNKS